MLAFRNDRVDFKYRKTIWIFSLVALRSFSQAGYFNSRPFNLTTSTHLTYVWKIVDHTLNSYFQLVEETFDEDQDKTIKGKWHLIFAFLDF